MVSSVAIVIVAPQAMAQSVDMKFGDGRLIVTPGRVFFVPQTLFKPVEEGKDTFDAKVDRNSGLVFDRQEGATTHFSYPHFIKEYGTKYFSGTLVRIDRGATKVELRIEYDHAVGVNAQRPYMVRARETTDYIFTRSGDRCSAWIRPLRIVGECLDNDPACPQRFVPLKLREAREAPCRVSPLADAQ